jgi:hypothetical protein
VILAAKREISQRYGTPGAEAWSLTAGCRRHRSTAREVAADVVAGRRVAACRLSGRLHGVASKQPTTHTLYSIRCTVCSAPIRSIQLREVDRDECLIIYVEETVACENGHTVLRLTQLPRTTE